VKNLLRAFATGIGVGVGLGLVGVGLVVVGEPPFVYAERAQHLALPTQPVIYTNPSGEERPGLAIRYTGDFSDRDLTLYVARRLVATEDVAWRRAQAVPYDPTSPYDTPSWRWPHE